MGHENQILEILEDMLKFEDIYACMLVRKGMQGIVPNTNRFRKEVMSIWNILGETMDEFFDVIQHYSKHNLGEVNFRLMDYEVMFFILPWSDTALVAICPALANKGLLEVEMENGRRKIIGILGRKQ